MKKKIKSFDLWLIELIHATVNNLYNFPCVTEYKNFNAKTCLTNPLEFRVKEDIINNLTLFLKLKPNCNK